LIPHDQEAVERLAGALRTAPIVAQLLLNRGISSPEAARRFLDAPLNGLYPPELLPGTSEAVERIWAAVQEKRRICIYGDYDVDGVTGSAILLMGLRLLGAEADLYVPHRLEEGYGLNCGALRQLAADGFSLVVTVDCGIASIEEAEEAKRLGLELIVTDHHEMKPALPSATVLVHPRLPQSAYPFGWLSGAAVALKVAWGLAQRASGSSKVTERFRDYLVECVGLASLGIIADVVPLHDENRILVRRGLKQLRESQRPGIRALCSAAGLERNAEVRAGDVGYRLAPRLNAAGRLGCARLVVDLLTTTQPEQALSLARFLEEQNAKRQTLERNITTEARHKIEVEGHDNDPALVLASAEWHPGVIGIVAGRLVDLYGRPALLIALPSPERAAADNDPAPVGQGSGRSIPGLPLHEALCACNDLLVSHGGHHAAAGLRILPENVGAFRERFCAEVRKYFPEGPPAPKLTLDAEVPLSTLTLGLLDDLDRLEPYGAENRRPLFLAGGLEVVGDPRRVGNGERHLSFRVRQGGTSLKAIAFGMADRLEELLSADRRCCLAFTPKLNEYMGRRSIDLDVTDFQPGAEAKLG
jgi:single-stranded-DNA-specific exonuclease